MGGVHPLPRTSLQSFYPSFMGYSLVAQFKEAIERVVICCTRVCMEKKDLREGLFQVSNLEEAARILVPQMSERLKELMGYTFFNPLPLRVLLSCLLNDFIDNMLGQASYMSNQRQVLNMCGMSCISCRSSF
ncbi:hypothetical protein UlMin_005763 [Ulmus minor]